MASFYRSKRVEKVKLIFLGQSLNTFVYEVDIAENRELCRKFVG